MFEDNAPFRDSIKLLLDDTEDINLHCTFPNANDALRQAKTHLPDVILMDIQMPDTDGISALINIRAHLPSQKVLMLTSFEDEQRIFAAICAGASGYAIKGDVENLEQGIRNVHNGGGHFSPLIAMRVMNMLRSPLVSQQSSYVPLTKRETEVVQKMVEGKSRKMIAVSLELSVETISSYTKEIYRKLHVNSASEAVREAIVRKLI